MRVSSGFLLLASLLVGMTRDAVAKHFSEHYPKAGPLKPLLLEWDNSRL
jgi:hypothetical protein